MAKKVLILSTGDAHGSYEAAYRITKFLYEAHYEVALVVRDKTKADPFVVRLPLHAKKITQRLVNRFFSPIDRPRTDKEYLFLDEDEKSEYLRADAVLAAISFVPDLIIAGMINGYGNTKLLAQLHEKTGALMYMLAADMAPFTGGCHYAWDCRGYEGDCRNCPAILEESKKDWAHENLVIKQRHVEKANIRVFTMSEWTSKQVSHSTLFKNQATVHNMNSLIDTSVFNSRHKGYAKRIFDLPADAKVIFAGSYKLDERRKGISFFLEALNLLWQQLDAISRDKIFILIAGSQANNEVLSQIPFKKHIIDFIKDYRLLSLAYQASDVFVCASLEDAGPMMVSEALACGTPVVGFEMGVIANMVEDGRNGYRAEMKNSADLAAGLYKIVSLSHEEYEAYSRNAVAQVEACSSGRRVLEVVQQMFDEGRKN